MLLKFMCTFLHKEELYLNALKLMDPDEVFPKERAIQALLCIDNGSFSLPSVLLLISYLGPIYNTSSKWVGFVVSAQFPRSYKEPNRNDTSVLGSNHDFSL